MPVKIPCGQCIGCRLEKSRQWAMRCVCESSLWDYNIFLTLTYDNEHLPADLSLHKDHLQKFMKRLRKEFGDGIRFYACGEYGNLNERPHYHLILFNFRLLDAEPIRYKPSPLFISPSLSKLWPFGFHSFGSVTFDSAAYVARYCTKKLTGDLAEEHYHGREPEFALMSRRPGIGHDWLQKYQSDVYPNDFVVMRGGLKLKPPTYFDNLYDKFTSNLDAVKVERRKKSLYAFKDFLNNDLNLGINSSYQSFLFSSGATEPFLHDSHCYSEKFQNVKLESKRRKEVC
ncbi:MAG: replication initiation protein [Bacteroidia bacterium]|nr:replication initiation protein [Bacteroidia bacterium]